MSSLYFGAVIVGAVAFFYGVSYLVTWLEGKWIDSHINDTFEFPDPHSPDMDYRVPDEVYDPELHQQ